MSPPKIVFVSRRQVFAAAMQDLPHYSPALVSAAGQYMDTLIDQRAALAVLDAEHPDWRALVLSGKNNAATRRVPVCLISDDAGQRADAIQCGADRALSWAEFPLQLGLVVAELARIPDPEVVERLECECGGALPALAAEGLAQFNRGEYYRQHDLFEALWVQTDGPVRDLYRAILQVGVAYYQIERGNFQGALKMLQRSVQWLYPLPDTCQGIDVARLRRDSYALRAALQRLGPERLQELDRSLLTKLHWRPPQSPST